MRIDKYLKVTRLIKRRTIAKELLDRELFYLNGKVVKPSKDVSIGDTIILVLGRKKITIKVLSLQTTSKKVDAKEMYEILNVEEIND